jgi:tRNA pseudouridine32 synthase / 23S rRNA pseudouridine746 synthase
VQPHARDAYQRLFRERAVEKRYEAIAPFRENLALPLTRKSRLVESAAFMQMHEIEGEPNAETRIALIEQTGEFARYALSPITGQKHQLRAHMSALGIAIANDPIYPTLKPAEREDDWNRPLKLLAKHIAFTDPVTGQRRAYESERCLDWDV